MKAIKYLDELIEFEENYQTGYTDNGDAVPFSSKKRLEDLKHARAEVFALSDVSGRSELFCKACNSKKIRNMPRWKCTDCGDLFGIAK